MCDTIGGELLLCFSREDVAARRLMAMLRDRAVEHVEYLDSLADRLNYLDLKPDPNFEFELHRVRVPVGQESFKTTYLQYFYKRAMFEAIVQAPDKTVATHSRSDFQFTVAPHHILSTSSSAPAGTPVSAKQFHFGSLYNQFKKRIGLTSTSSQNEKIRVLVLDTGVANDAPITVANKRNIVDPKNPGNIDDDNGHGTAIALLIHDLAPNAEFLIYKVADSTGRISEWDALAGIAAQSDAHVVNLSMQFGLMDKGKGCAVCGRESHASRSAVFENIITQLAKRTPRPLVIAAAGNYRDKELAFPARFGDVLAIGGITSGDTLTSSCNSGDLDQVGAPHKNHFVMPGGEDDPAHPEPILSSTGAGAKDWSGSSFAAAFASGFVAQVLENIGLSNFNYNTFVADLRRHADKSLPNYPSPDYGNGLMHT